MHHALPFTRRAPANARHTHARHPGPSSQLTEDALRGFAPVGFVGHRPTPRVRAAGAPIRTAAERESALATPRSGAQAG